MASLKSLYPPLSTPEPGQIAQPRPQTVRPYYVLALLVLALLALFAYMGLHQFTLIQETSSTLVNVSGRQRMLAQRATLLATMLVNESNSVNRAVWRSQLSNTIVQFATAHDQLTQGRLPGDAQYDLSPEIYALYFDEPASLNQQVSQFLTLAGSLLAASNDTLTPQHPDFVTLFDTSSSLVSSLDTAVSQHILEENARVQTLERLEVMLLIATLVVLVLVTIFIFYPMERHIRREQQYLLNEIDMRKEVEVFLLHSEARLRLAMDTAQMGTWDWNLLTNETRWDASTKRLFGQPEDFVSTIEHYVAQIHTDDYQTIADELKVSLATGKPFDLEYRITRPDGQIRWMYSKGQTQFDEIGKPVMMTGVVQDITERKTLEKQALDMAIDREYGRVLADFIRDSSHDLRTPLSIINTSLYLLKKTESAEKRLERIQNIEDQVEHMDRLIEDLHMMSNLDMATDLQKSSVRVNQLIGDITDIYRKRITDRGQQLVLKLAADLPDIELDANEVGHALSNLLDNALLYTPAGGTITVESEKTDKYFVLTVLDTGAGIAASHLDYIFERFYKVDSARPTGQSGPGLGLTMVKKIVEMHGGSVEVESTPGKGSRFRLYFPLVHVMLTE